MAQPAPRRTQSSTSLSRFYNAGANGGPVGEDEMADPKLDFCNAFWGQGDRGYEVVMARLRGSARTLDELKAFWKERSAIEEDYARRLQKLSKTTLGKDEIGDLAAALQNCLTETSQQAQYHQSLASEIRTNVEGPTAELAARLVGFKKGQQAAMEKSWRNKGVHEGHVAKARKTYESDCLQVNSHTANQALSQGKEADKLQTKLEKARGNIGKSEQDFRQFVGLLEGTHRKWEQEWKGFCDVVQDLEEDRLAMTKDIIWAYANAVSQVCVEDDSSCERVREKLEQFEPQSDMVSFVRGWGTGDQIPDAPRFVNYSAGEYPSHPTSHIAHFQRDSNKAPLSALSSYAPEPKSAVDRPASRQERPVTYGSPSDTSNRAFEDTKSAPPPPASEDKPKQPFGGVALPGMAPAPSARAPSPAPSAAIVRTASPTAASEALPKRYSSMGPPAPAQTMTMPEPRVSSRQGPPTPTHVDDEDPLAKALADMRRDPPPPDSIRRNTSHRTSRYGIPQASSPAPGAPSNNRASYQAPAGALSPPPTGHTAAALAQSMDQFQRQSNKRASASYASGNEYAASRSASPGPNPGRPTSAMMQPPSQPTTHIADEVLSQYHQAFPGEREKQSRSRAGSVISNISGHNGGAAAGRGRSPSPGPQPHHQLQLHQGQASPVPREGFSGIGAGGRSPSPAPGPAPGRFASPGPSPNIAQGNLGPQNMGIKLDAAGGVAQDSMAEAYRRQYQQQQGQPGHEQGFGGYQGAAGFGGSSQGHGQGQGQGLKSPPPVGTQRPTSGFGHQSQQPPLQHQQSYQSSVGQYPPAQVNGGYGQQPQPQGQVPLHGQGPNGQYGQSGFGSGGGYGAQGHAQAQTPVPQQGPQGGGGYSNGAAPPSGYRNSYQPPAQAAPQPQAGQAYNGQYAGPQGAGPSHFNRTASPVPQHQQQYARTASPAPAPAAQQYGRSPSPAPGPAGGYRQQQPQQQYQPPPQQQQQYGGYQQQPQSPAAAFGHNNRQSQQYQPPVQQQQPPQQQQYGGPAANGGRGGRSPSPQPGVAPANAAPTGQWSTTGLPVLFYVKALYDYQAQSGAEFDFQAGDIIAVTSTPDDGWWSGELLDEARRLPGRTDFPSNFVCLF